MASLDRANRIQCLRIIVEYFWMYLRQLEVATQRLGAPGRDAVTEGVRHYGRYRGESMRESVQGCAEGRDALALLRAWDVADLALASTDSRLQVEGDARAATVKLLRVPGSEYFKGRDGARILADYWRETLRGIEEGYDERLAISPGAITAEPDRGWSLSLRFSGDTARAAHTRPDDALDDARRGIELSRRTFGVLGALCMYTTRALIARFDATGEKAAREALYNFGYERAQGMREQALAEGLPLNLSTWTSIIQRRDPHASSFTFKGPTHVSAGVFQTTCAYCPCAQVWAEEGNEGLVLGYIYDTEVHRGLVEGFHPGGIVTWDKVKTRGDKVCNFRFYIPELVADGDPEWARAKRTTGSGV